MNISSLSQIRKYNGNQSTIAPKKCQKCLESGHYTFECKNERNYSYRPSRTVRLSKKLERKKSTATPNITTSKDMKKKGLADKILAENKRKRKEESSSSEESSDESGSQSDSDSSEEEDKDEKSKS